MSAVAKPYGYPEPTTTTACASEATGNPAPIYNNANGLGISKLLMMALMMMAVVS